MALGAENGDKTNSDHRSLPNRVAFLMPTLKSTPTVRLLPEGSVSIFSANGEMLEGSSGADDRHNVGEQATVFYDPIDPNRATLEITRT
jgi:hypothetical protein